jgi:hypothetical protein
MQRAFFNFQDMSAVPFKIAQCVPLALQICLNTTVPTSPLLPSYFHLPLHRSPFYARYILFIRPSIIRTPIHLTTAVQAVLRRVLLCGRHRGAGAHYSLDRIHVASGAQRIRYCQSVQLSLFLSPFC